jgi:hypothetical protein
METLAAGFEKQKVDCVTNSSKEGMENKQLPENSCCSYEGSQQESF